MRKPQGMHIETIDDPAGLTRVEDAWNAVYDADPDAQVFLSWKWLSAWLTLPYCSRPFVCGALTLPIQAA
jgi:hypothetical protein